MKRFWKIARYTLLSLLLLLVLAWLAIQTSPVQNFLARKVTDRLSRDLNTTISIKKVDFGLFNRMLLEGVLVEDRAKDTLLYAGVAEVKITDWFFFKDQVVLEYIGLKDAQINFQRTDSIWNYQFLADYFSGPKKAKSKQQSIDYNFKVVDLENVAFVMKDGWRGENQILRIGALKMDPENVDMNKKLAHIKSVTLVKPQFYLYNYKGNRPPRAKVNNKTIIIDSSRLRWNFDNWDVAIDELTIEDGLFKNDAQTERDPYPHFDGQHILFSDINGTFKNFTFRKDTIAGDVKLKTKERSGFEVKSLVAKMKFHPELMEFNNLDIRTNRSHLTNYFAMHYSSFNDMSEFISKVEMEGKFKGTEIYSDDIAFFAPEMKTWDRGLKLEGEAKGTVNNLHAKNVTLAGVRGSNTYLNGDISLSGLPDIDNLYIDFNAKELRTTYADAIRIAPRLEKINMPRIDRIQWLKFKGNFTGFLKDFVTYGTIETNLGSITSDLNMKLHSTLPVYSGRINVSNFNLGGFLDNTQLGNLTFEGKINGKGFTLKNLDATLDGNVKELEFNGYAYHDITVNGDFEKKLFNGKLISNDPNLSLNLEGLIDLNNDEPRFDFNATVQNTNLKKLNFSNDNIDFSGKLHADFTGSDIDHFIGIAKIHEASIYRDGKRFSFDSLVVESRIADNNKTLTVLSNEFDAALAGEFSIRELPAAFQTFLNRYYPTYIKPSKTKLQNENFSFVITTKNVDEYINVINKDLTGFNFSTISGRINSKENLLDLNAEVPEFKYKNLSFNNTVLKGRGTLDSLILEANVADTYINDSLHLPETYLRINSANDLSRVRLKTSANTTLNSADIASRVQTIKDGVKIYFDPTTFVINGKEWSIAENGELVLSKDLISADNVRIYSEDQEILVTTVPSEIGTSNDVKINLKKINLGDITPFFVKDYRIEGLYSGSVDIVDPFGKLELNLEGLAEHLRLDNDSIGLVTVRTSYNTKTGRIDVGAKSDNKDFVLTLMGSLPNPTV